MNSIQYECSINATEHITITGSINGKHLYINSEQCIINGCVKSDILYLKIRETIEFGTDKLLIKNQKLFYVALKDTLIFRCDNLVIVEPFNMKDQAKILLNADGININHCGIKSNGVCRVQKTRNIKLLSSTFNANELYFDSMNNLHIKATKLQTSTLLVTNCDVMEIKDNSSMECADRCKITNINTFDMQQKCSIVIIENNENIQAHKNTLDKYESFDCVMSVKELIKIAGIVQANNIHLNTNVLNLSGCVKSYLKIKSNDPEMLENNMESISYECVFDIKHTMELTGSVKVRNVRIVVNECHINGSMESDILYLKANELITFGSNKLFIQNNKIFHVALRANLFCNQHELTIRPNNDNNTQDQLKIVIKSDSMTITDCEIQSKKMCQFINIENLEIKSSNVFTSMLEMNHCNHVKYNQNAIIHCQNKLTITDINNLEISADSAIYTAQHSDTISNISSENKCIAVVDSHQSVMDEPPHVIEVLENEDLLSCFIHIQSIIRNGGKLYDDELIKIKINLYELPSEKATFYMYEPDKNANELAEIKLENNTMSDSATIDLVDVMDENFTTTQHSLAVCTDIKNPKPCSNFIQFTLPNLKDYLSMNTEVIPQIISMDTVQASLFNNVVHVYWDNPLELNILANMEKSIKAEIEYIITYINTDGSTTQSIINNLPLTMPVTNVPILFTVTTIIIKNNTKYESPPSKLIKIDFATSKEQRAKPIIKEISTDEFKMETENTKTDNGSKHENGPYYTENKQHENIFDGFECTLEINECFKMCGVMKSNNIKLIADECNIEGHMESNVLSINAKNIHFKTNNLFIKTESQLNITLMENVVFSTAGKMLIQPIDDDAPPMVLIDSSSMIVQKCKIESYGNCEVKNITQFCCTKFSQIDLKHATFNQISCIEVVDCAKLSCSGTADVKDVDTFVINDAMMSMQNGSCNIKLKSLFSADEKSIINCSYGSILIECDQDIKLNGKIEIGECYTFRIYAKGQIICNEKCQIQSSSVFKIPEEKQLKTMVQEYLKNQNQSQDYFQSNYFIDLYGKLKINFHGKITGNESLCMMHSDETVNILNNVLFNSCHLYVYSVNKIIFNSKYDYTNGQCHLNSDQSLDIDKNSIILSDKVSFFGKESIRMNGEINGTEINIASHNECNLECKLNSIELIIKSKNLSCSRQSIRSETISIECTEYCKLLNSSNISYTKQLAINASYLELSNSSISGINESEMILDIVKKANISDTMIESDILRMMNTTSSLVFSSSNISINQILFKDINSLQFCTGTEILYSNKFHAQNIKQFTIKQNAMISINHGGGSFDSNAQNEFFINSDDFSVDDGAKIYFSFQKAEIKCNNNLNLNGIIHMLKCNVVKEEITKTLTWQQIQLNDLTQYVHDHLVGQHYIQLYSKNTININGELIAPNALSLIDCANQINILQNANMNTGLLYIRSIKDIYFNGKIYNENGECFIGANNKLTLDKDGDICLLFLKHWSITEIIECTITADNLTVEQLEKRLNALNDKINNFTSSKEKDFELQELRRELETAERKYKRSTREISDTVDKTGLSEQNIRLFLQQLNKIRDCVIQQPASLAKMNQKLSTFITLMRREFNTELSIESYFEFQNLKKYATALKKGGYIKLKELECSDENDPEYQRILSVCQKVKGFNARDKRELQHICLKSDSWKRYQNEKINVVTKQMAETAPLLKDCFGSIDNAMKQIQAATKNALDSSHNRSLTLKSKDPVKILSKTADDSLKTISQFKKNKCKEYKGDKVIKLKALTVATGVSDCCSEIIKNQQNVAGSILLTKSILKLKPNELKKKGKNQSLEMRVKKRYCNAIQQAWTPYIEEQNKLKSLTHGRKKRTKQIKLNEKDKKQTFVVKVIDNLSFPLCFIQIVSIQQKIRKIMDDEKIKISIEINQIPSKTTKYYLFETEKGKIECLGTINVRKNKTKYCEEIDMIEFEPDSENEMVENDSIQNRNCKHMIALYKDEKKRKIISNCIEIILPEFHEYISKEIPTTVSIPTIKAYRINKENIKVFWQCPPKINVFGTIKSVKYKVNYTDKNSKKPQQLVDTLPLIISNKCIPISMQIKTIISTTSQMIESNPIKFVIGNSRSSIGKKISNPTVRKTSSTKPKVKSKKRTISIPSFNANNQSTKAKTDNVSSQTSFKYRPSNCSGIYGSYQIQSNVPLKQVIKYKPSFSSGIYGSYFYPQEMKYTELQLKEQECLDLLYTYLSKCATKKIDHGQKLKIWIAKHKFSLENICQDIANPKKSKIKSFNGAIFKKLVTFTKSKSWKTKQKEIILMSSAKLWNIVDDGVINIWCSDLVIIEIAMKYFNFFGKFRQSFDALVQLNPQQTVVQAAKNKAKNFLKNMVSNIVTIANDDEKIDLNKNNQIVKQLECIANDIKEFELVQKVFHRTINQLEKFALKCIKECIKEAPNSDRFDNAQKQRDKYRVEFEKLQKLYDEKEKQMNNEYDKWIALKLKLQARKTAVEYEQRQKQNQK